MNSCILMAEIIQEPQLRYTADNQTAISEMVVQFDSIRADDPPATLKTIAWGNRAEEIYKQYKVGDRVVLEGRLSMISVDRPEGFKEKRAELVVSKVYPLGTAPATTSESRSTQTVVPPATPNPNVVSLESRRQGTVAPERTVEFTPTREGNGERLTGNGASGPGNYYPPERPSNAPPMPQTFDSESDQDLDEIPF